MSQDTYICSCCGKEVAGFPMSFAADFPDPYAALNTDERDLRTIIASDQCVIDGTDFYLRGLIELPIKDTELVFLWGCWARIHEADYDTIDEHWETIGRETMFGPYKGRLANKLPIYPDTLNAKLEIRVREVGTRPLFFLTDTDNLMTLEQRGGISLHQAEEYSRSLMQMWPD